VVADNIARVAGTDQAWYFQKPAWHGKGEVGEKTLTARQLQRQIPVFRKRIETAPVYMKLGGKFIEIEDRMATYREGTRVAMGIVGRETYETVQDGDGLLLLEAVGQHAGAGRRRKPSFVTGGALGSKAERSFASIDLTLLFGDMLKVKRDPSRQESHLFGTWGHDGLSALRIGLWRNRVECQNMLNAALADAEGSGMLVTIRHVGDVSANIDDARRILGFVETQVKADTALMNALQDVPIAKPKLWLPLFTEVVVPMPDDAEAGGRMARSRTEAREAIAGLFANSKTLVGVPNSAYRAYQAVAEYADHYRPLRIGADTPTEVAADRRFRSITEGPAADMKGRALDWLRSEFLTPAN
jgi:phage/plasmid-like protein (TIGR03299 family)